MNTADRYTRILKTYWGYENFRGVQRDIIESIGEGHDTLGLMPTGGGKSITFQVPALATEGLCLVISPLISLMKDQVANLRRRNIPAGAIYAGLSRQEVLTCLENCIFGGYKFLYISPERLTSELFLTKLRRMRVSFIAVDEAHCISQWGYDFRPSYLQIANIRQLLPDTPVLALTATATPRVVADIQQRLGFRTPRVFQMSFARKNLSYQVHHVSNKHDEIIRLLRVSSGAAIVYTRSRKKTRELAEWLNAEGISAFYYHAGLTNLDKDVRQTAWQTDKVRVMVATNAFGMGIDKPDVRLVLHADVPDALEAYFQEAGRAGRDGLPAKAILLYGRHDRQTLMRRIPATFPPPEYVADIYEHLAYKFGLAMGDGYDVTYAFDLQDFCRTYHYFPTIARSALQILTRAGYINYTDEEENASRVMMLIHREQLYHLPSYPYFDAVLQALLRLYTGVFSDYAFINENEIATLTNLTAGQVYDTLVAMTKQHILHYVPQQRSAHVHYPTRRIPMEDIVLRDEVYADLKAQYVTRIKAVVQYAECEDTCRQALLLRYFGEHFSEPCGICDHCLRHALSSGLRAEDMATAILRRLEVSGRLPLTRLRQHFGDTPAFRTALSQLINEGQALLQGAELLRAGEKPNNE